MIASGNYNSLFLFLRCLSVLTIQSQHLQELAHRFGTSDGLPRNEAVTGKSLLKLQTTARRRKARDKWCGKHVENM